MGKTAVTITVDENFADKDYITHFSEDGTVYSTERFTDKYFDKIVDCVVKETSKIHYHAMFDNNELVSDLKCGLETVAEFLRDGRVFAECICKTEGIDLPDLSGEKHYYELGKLLFVAISNGIPLPTDRFAMMTVRSAACSNDNIAKLCMYAVEKNLVDFSECFTEFGTCRISGIPDADLEAYSLLGDVLGMYEHLAERFEGGRFIIDRIGLASTTSAYIKCHVYARSLSERFICKLVNGKKLTDYTDDALNFKVTLSFILMHSCECLKDCEILQKIFAFLLNKKDDLTEHEYKMYLLFLGYWIFQSGDMFMIKHYVEVTPGDVVHKLIDGSITEFVELYKRERSVDLKIVEGKLPKSIKFE